MKKLYRPLLKGTNWALAGILSLMGLGISCDSIIGVGTDEYGVPHADFKVKGKVTDAEGKPVQGIMVHAQTTPDEYNYVDTTYTDANGNYEVRAEVLGIKQVDVYAEDIDGELNGSFQPDSARILSEDINLTGGSSWLIGRDEKEINFTLKHKTENKE